MDISFIVELVEREWGWILLPLALWGWLVWSGLQSREDVRSRARIIGWAKASTIRQQYNDALKYFLERVEAILADGRSFHNTSARVLVTRYFCCAPWTPHSFFFSISLSHLYPMAVITSVWVITGFRLHPSGEIFDMAVRDGVVSRLCYLLLPVLSVFILRRISLRLWMVAISLLTAPWIIVQCSSYVMPYIVTEANMYGAVALFTQLTTKTYTFYYSTLPLWLLEFSPPVVTAAVLLICIREIIKFDGIGAARVGMLLSGAILVFASLINMRIGVFAFVAWALLLMMLLLRVIMGVRSLSRRAIYLVLLLLVSSAVWPVVFFNAVGSGTPGVGVVGPAYVLFFASTFSVYNAIFDWLSFGFTRGTIFLIASECRSALDALKLALLDFLVAIVLLCIAALVMLVFHAGINSIGAMIYGLKLVGLTEVLVLFVCDAGNDSLLWVYVVFLSPLIPTLAHLSLAIIVSVCRIGSFSPIRNLRSTLLEQVEVDAHARVFLAFYVFVQPLVIVALLGSMVFLSANIVSKFDLSSAALSLTRSFPGNVVSDPFGVKANLSDRDLCLVMTSQVMLNEVGGDIIGSDRLKIPGR